MTSLSRRGLLGSLLAAPTVIVTPGLLMPVWDRTPVLWGDGVHDDGPAVKAFLEGERFRISSGSSFTVELFKDSNGSGNMLMSPSNRIHIKRNIVVGSNNVELRPFHGSWMFQRLTTDKHVAPTYSWCGWL